MRLFLGIDVAPIKEKLISLQNKFSKVLEAKFVEEKNLHLTINYLGEYNPYKAVKRLEKLKHSKENISSNNLGVFPNPNNPKVLFLSVNPKDYLEELHLKTNKLLRFKPRNRYHPHITLARVNKINDKELFIKELNKNLPKEKMEINSLNLYNSYLTEKGPIYTVIKEFELN